MQSDCFTCFLTDLIVSQKNSATTTVTDNDEQSIYWEEMRRLDDWQLAVIAVAAEQRPPTKVIRAVENEK